MTLENVKYRSGWSDSRLIEYYWIFLSSLSDKMASFFSTLLTKITMFYSLFSFQVVDSLSKIKSVHLCANYAFFFFKEKKLVGEIILRFGS